MSLARSRWGLLPETLVSGLDRFLSDAVRRDVDLRQRGRLLVACYWILIVNSAFFAVLTATQEQWRGSLVAGLSAAAATLLLWRLRLAAGLGPATHGVVLCVFGLITGSSMQLGGWGTPPLNWLPLLPFVATLTSGVRAGAVAAILGVAGYSLFYALKVLGVDTGSDPDAVAVAALPDRLLQIGSTFLFSLAYESLKRRALGELRATTQRLELEVAGHEETRKRLDVAQEEVLQSARRSGMVEVATGILHDTGNALNYVTTSSSLLSDRLREFPVVRIQRAMALLEDATAAAAERDAKRTQLVGEYLRELSGYVATEHKGLLDDVDHLRRGLDQVCDMVNLQQRYATDEEPSEELDVGRTIHDVLQLQEGGLRGRGIEAKVEIGAVPRLRIRKQKLLQIMLNLLDNAQRAVADAKRQGGQIRVVVASRSDTEVRIEVSDNGVGIAPEKRARIFQRGFTTRADGHGMGLYGAALAAHDLGGQLTFDSEGLGKGATFVVTIPVGHRRA